MYGQRHTQTDQAIGLIGMPFNNHSSCRCQKSFTSHAPGLRGITNRLNRCSQIIGPKKHGRDKHKGLQQLERLSIMPTILRAIRLQVKGDFAYAAGRFRRISDDLPTCSSRRLTRLNTLGLCSETSWTINCPENQQGTRATS